MNIYLRADVLSWLGVSSSSIHIQIFDVFMPINAGFFDGYMYVWDEYLEITYGLANEVILICDFIHISSLYQSPPLYCMKYINMEKDGNKRTDYIQFQ